jgi:hypothetical protein
MNISDGTSLTIDPLKASGIIYKQTARDRYGRADDLMDENRLHPYGKREDVAIGLLKKGVIEVSSTDIGKANMWNTVDRTGPNVTIADGDTEVVGLTPDQTVTLGLKYGSKIEIGGETFYIRHTHATAGGVHVSKPVSGDKSGVIVSKCQIDDPLYLNKFFDAKNIQEGTRVVHGYTDLSDIPFTPIPPSMDDSKPAGSIDQLVGYIESPIAARIDLTIDVAGGVK